MQVVLKVCLLLALLSGCGGKIFEHSPNVSGYDSNDVTTVYLIPHSHDDVGWLKTPSNYFYGDDQQTQWAGVQYTLDNVVTELSVNQNFKFSIVEMAFLDMWWRSANDTMKSLMADQVKKGRIELLNAGWCMSDEATVYYEDAIDQMGLGLRWAKERFGVVPTVAWQIDPFGHQASFATLGHQMGFNAIFFARIHFQDKIARESRKAMELLWKPPQVSGNQDQILAHVNYYMYMPPPGFCFDQTCVEEPIKSDPTLEGYNVDIRAQAFVSYFKNMSNSYQSNNLLHTLGSDFHWSNARMWTLNMDKLMSYINNKPELNLKVRYATPSEYLEAIYKQNLSFPEKTDDFFPYADYPEAYWSGYFTSRVAIKGLVRDTGRWLQSLRTHLALLRMSNRSSYLNSHPNESETALLEMEKMMGVLQHHDAVSGTEKQKVANWYVLIASKAKSALTSFYDNIIKEQTSNIIGETPAELFQTHWNLTQSEWGISRALKSGKRVLLQLYNPGPDGAYPVRVKVDSSPISLVGANNASIPAEIICSNSKDPEDCELFFDLNISQTGWGFVKLQQSSSGGPVKVISLSQLSIQNPTREFKLSSTSRLKLHLTLSKQAKFELTLPSGVHPFDISYGYYVGYSEVGQKSGAYIFRPSNSTINGPKKYSSQGSVSFAEGQRMVVVALQEETTYTKLYFSKKETHLESSGVEIETFVDSIDVKDKQGKEIVVQINTSVANGKTFYTDSNGLEEQKRVLDYMPTWNWIVTQPVAANYYPINSHIKIRGTNSTVSVLVDRARGGAVIREGVIELMIHRRLLEDDVRGVWEVLNETQADGKGLTQKVRNYLLFGENNRNLQKRLDQPIQVTWSNTNSSSFAKCESQTAPFSVPNEAKLWLRGMTDGSYLLRVQHLDTLSSNSTTVIVPDGWSLSELTLGSNQLLSEWRQKQYQWRGKPSSSEQQRQQEARHIKRPWMLETARILRGSKIELKSLEMRTFSMTKS